MRLTQHRSNHSVTVPDVGVPSGSLAFREGLRVSGFQDTAAAAGGALDNGRLERAELGMLPARGPLTSGLVEAEIEQGD